MSTNFRRTSTNFSRMSTSYGSMLPKSKNTNASCWNVWVTRGLFATRALTLLTGWMSYPGNRTRGHPLCGNRNLQEELV